MLPRATSPSAQPFSLHVARWPPACLPGPLSPVSSPRCLLQAAHPPGAPLSSSLCPSLCLSRDQVLRVLAENELQLSLLRDLEGLKPQQVRTAQGLGTCSPFSHHIRLRPRTSPPPAPNLLSDGSAKHTELWKNQRWLLFRKGWEHLPRRLGSSCWLSPLSWMGLPRGPCGGRCGCS